MVSSSKESLCLNADNAYTARSQGPNVELNRTSCCSCESIICFGSGHFSPIFMVGMENAGYDKFSAHFSTNLVRYTALKPPRPMSSFHRGPST